MKKLLFFLFCFGIPIFAQNYEAKASIQAIYWQNDDEWGANLRPDLYLNGNLLRPYIDYDPSSNSYLWQQLVNGIWFDRSTDYIKGTDGMANQVWQWRVQITGTGFSITSDPLNVVKHGIIKPVTTYKFKHDGTSANLNVTLKEWAEHSWIDWNANNIFLSEDADNVLKDSLYGLPGQKFHRWETDNPASIYYNNYAGIYVNDLTNIINIYHKICTNVTLNLNSDISSLRISLTDPWLTKTTQAYYQAPYGYRSLGLSAIPEEVENGVYQGVLLNQPYTGNNPVYYSISIPSSVTVGGQAHSIILRNWELTNAQLQSPTQLTTGVVFTNSPASVTANLKGIQLSNNQSAIVNNGQRKLVRSDNGVLHLVYESMGHVWYERSTNNGITWSLANNGNPVDRGLGKLPGIDTYPTFTGNDNIVLVFQEAYSGNEVITVQYFQNGSLSFSNSVTNCSYSAVANPIIAYNSARVLLVWYGGDGLYYRMCTPVISNNYFSWYGSATPIAGTNSQSNHPTITANYELKPSGEISFHLAWDDNYTSIKYQKLTRQSNETILFSTLETISTGSGYTLNSNPSIASANNYPAITKK